jgi:hypothetical protein
MEDYMSDALAAQVGGLGIAPGATYGPAKRWFPERFAALADKLYDSFPYQGILLGGKDDGFTAEEVRRKLLRRQPLYVHAFLTELRDWIIRIHQCKTGADRRLHLLYYIHPHRPPQQRGIQPKWFSVCLSKPLDGDLR